MTPEEKTLSKGFKLDAEQIAWRRAKIAQIGEDLICQEYPLTPDSAFVSSDFDAFIRPELVIAARKITDVKPYGSLIVAWGADDWAQTHGPGTLTGVVAMATGYQHGIALYNDGAVRGWAYDYYGAASAPANATNMVAIAAGAWHSLALRQNGTVLAWGDDSFGQTDVPPGLSNVVAIAGGGFHSLALEGDGTHQIRAVLPAAQGSHHVEALTAERADAIAQ